MSRRIRRIRVPVPFQCSLCGDKHIAGNCVYDGRERTAGKYTRKRDRFKWQEIPCGKCGQCHRWHECPKTVPRVTTRKLHAKPLAKPRKPYGLIPPSPRLAEARQQSKAKRAELSRLIALHNLADSTPVDKYLASQYAAKRRNVPFMLTFAEWWQIWHDSGHWEERGTANGCYVMCRNADQGPYAVGNVRIDTVRGNALEQLEIAKAKQEAYREDES